MSLINSHDNLAVIENNKLQNHISVWCRRIFQNEKHFFNYRIKLSFIWKIFASNLSWSKLNITIFIEEILKVELFF